MCTNSNDVKVLVVMNAVYAFRCSTIPRGFIFLDNFTITTPNIINTPPNHSVDVGMDPRIKSASSAVNSGVDWLINAAREMLMRLSASMYVEDGKQKRRQRGPEQSRRVGNIQLLPMIFNEAIEYGD